MPNYPENFVLHMELIDCNQDAKSTTAERAWKSFFWNDCCERLAVRQLS
jgi:hypothetical protein